jgi:hypothetical protein
MLESIKKMMNEYDLKIADCDKLIDSQRKAIKVMRRDKSECPKLMKELSDMRKDRAITQAQRQCYVQAKYDFDSLIDDLPT